MAKSESLLHGDGYPEDPKFYIQTPIKSVLANSEDKASRKFNNDATRGVHDLSTLTVENPATLHRSIPMVFRYL